MTRSGLAGMELRGDHRTGERPSQRAPGYHHGVSLRQILASQARVVARARAARWAGWTALLGAVAVAVALFAERAGLDVPLVRLPGLPPVEAADRVFRFLAVSFAGLLQGAALLLAVFAAAGIVSVLGRRVRPAAAWTARALDGALDTDRFTAAREAAGPLREIVHREAVRPPPPPRTLAPRRRPGPARWLVLLAALLVFAVALLPGAAPGEPGRAPVAGAPRGGETEVPLELALAGPEGPIGPEGPVWLDVTATAGAAPEEDLEFRVEAAVDGDAFRPTGVLLFLPAGAPGAETGRFDLRPWLEGLEPGRHRAVAEAGGVRSNAYEFELEPPDGSAPEPKPKPDEPEPEPDPKPPPGPQPEPKGGPEDVVPKYVEPLVRDGAKVRKQAKVPVEVPEGGRPRPRPLDDAWPELERRREAALQRRGLSPDARRLVREYFDGLRPSGDGK